MCIPFYQWQPETRYPYSRELWQSSGSAVDYMWVLSKDKRQVQLKIAVISEQAPKEHSRTTIDANKCK